MLHVSPPWDGTQMEWQLPEKPRMSNSVESVLQGLTGAASGNKEDPVKEAGDQPQEGAGKCLDGGRKREEKTTRRNH